MSMGIAKPQAWPADDEQYLWMQAALGKRRKELKTKRNENYQRNYGTNDKTDSHSKA